MPITLKRLSKIPLRMTPRRVAVQYINFAHRPARYPHFYGQALLDRMDLEIYKSLLTEDKNIKNHSAAPRKEAMNWCDREKARFAARFGGKPPEDPKADLHDKVRMTYQGALRRACFLVELYKVAFQSLDTQLRLSFELTTTVCVLIRTPFGFNCELLERLEQRHNMLLLSLAIVERVESEHLNAKVLPDFFREMCVGESDLLRVAIQHDEIEPRVPSARNYTPELCTPSDFTEKEEGIATVKDGVASFIKAVCSRPLVSIDVNPLISLQRHLRKAYIEHVRNLKQFFRAATEWHAMIDTLAMTMNVDEEGIHVEEGLQEDDEANKRNPSPGPASP